MPRRVQSGGEGKRSRLDGKKNLTKKIGGAMGKVIEDKFNKKLINKKERKKGRNRKYFYTKGNSVHSKRAGRNK